MEDFNNEAKRIFEELTETEQEKAFSILKTLNGLEIEKAYWMLQFCKVVIETKAIVKI